MWKLIIALILTFAVSSSTTAQTFPLNKPIPEQGIYCFTETAAEDIANEPMESNAVLVEHLKAGNCIVAQAVMVTYTKKVYQNGKVNVYEGTIGKVTVYNPSTSTADGEKDI